MVDLSLPNRPAVSAEPFRFLDLPAQIRNKIYGILLTVPKPPRRTLDGGDSASGYVSLKLDIEPQILRTCRMIKSEAEYVLRKSNLFIKVSFKVLLEEFMGQMIPLLSLKPKDYKRFKAFVLSHEITVPKPLQEKPRVFVCLHRDLERFCSGLASSQSTLTQHRDLMSHNITIRDPCAGSPINQQEPFLSRELQEKLVAPYRAELRNIPHFNIKGTIPQDLKVAVEREVRRPNPADPEGVVREVEDLKAEGNLYFRRGDLYFRDGNGGASEYWNEALGKIQRVMEDESCNNIREQGGQQFINRLAELSFNLNSNKAMDYLKCMRHHADSQELLDELGLKLSDCVYEAICTTSKFPGSTWRSSPAQMAKLAYRKAVRCRLGGEPLMLTQAEAAIQQALASMPGDADIRKERDMIAQWRRQIDGIRG